MNSRIDTTDTPSPRIRFMFDRMGRKTFIDFKGFVHHKQDWLSLVDSFVQESWIKDIHPSLEYSNENIAWIKDLMLAIYENKIDEVERLCLFWINELWVDYDTSSLKFILQEIENEKHRNRMWIRTWPEQIGDNFWAREKVNKLINEPIYLINFDLENF